MRVGNRESGIGSRQRRVARSGDRPAARADAASAYDALRNSTLPFTVSRRRRRPPLPIVARMRRGFTRPCSVIGKSAERLPFTVRMSKIGVEVRRDFDLDGTVDRRVLEISRAELAHADVDVAVHGRRVHWPA